MNTRKNSGRPSRLVGAHCSIAGGLADAVRRGAELGCTCIQIFTKNSNRWSSLPLLQSDIDSFQKLFSSSSVRLIFAHSGYLINLASVEPAVHELSMRSMREELDRAEVLELPFVVVHPGSHKGAGELVGIVQVVESVKKLLSDTEGYRVMIALETTAGQGRSIGYKFEHFREIFKRLPERYQKRVGVCLDTAHIFAAGYDIRKKGTYEKAMREFDEMIGAERLLAIHLNDSAKELGSCVDRHEELGKGFIGLNGFKMILNDKRFAGVPVVIETPKGDSTAADIRNLALISKISCKS